MTLPYEAMVAALVRQGVPREKAERQATIETGGTWADAPPLAKRGIVWPVKLTIPWSRLVSDNAKYTVHGTRLVLQDRYREAKGAIRTLARDTVGRDVDLAAEPLRLVAAVYVPDRRPHDLANFAKCVHDALEGAVYVSDRWLDDVRWYRAGVDVDAPRAELTIAPLGTVDAKSARTD